MSRPAIGAAAAPATPVASASVAPAGAGSASSFMPRPLPRDGGSPLLPPSTPNAYRSCSCRPSPPSRALSLRPLIAPARARRAQPRLVRALAAGFLPARCTISLSNSTPSQSFTPLRLAAAYLSAGPPGRLAACVTAARSAQRAAAATPQRRTARARGRVPAVLLLRRMLLARWLLVGCCRRVRQVASVSQRASAGTEVYSTGVPAAVRPL